MKELFIREETVRPMTIPKKPSTCLTDNPLGGTRSHRPRQVLPYLGAFALGGLAASLAFWCCPRIGEPAGTTASRGGTISSQHVSSHFERPKNTIAERCDLPSLLPTRTFDCPGCGTAVPTNDNSLPILLLGFLAQGAFGMRFVVQWIASERAKASVFPEAFWWLSIGGAVFLALYGWALLAWPIIIGQGLNCLIYGRNLALLQRRSSPSAEMTTQH